VSDDKPVEFRDNLQEE